MSRHPQGIFPTEYKAQPQVSSIHLQQRHQHPVSFQFIKRSI
jgi:hypothetical protein